MPQTRLITLIDELRRHSGETEWLEFKHNNADPMQMGKRISALSNSARVADKHMAYMVWGIADENHSVVGTLFNPSTEKCGNQPLQFWLEQQLNPAPPLTFTEVQHANGRVIVLEIPAATHAPVNFQNIAYIRIGSATPKLTEYPQRERLLWTKLQPYAWETGAAATFINSDDVLDLIDYPSYFELTKQPLPDNREGILEKLEADRIIENDVGDKWNITNAGAILFARKLDRFSTLSRKAVRVVQYEGSDRTTSTRGRQDGGKGYANGFSGLIEFINNLLPRREEIGQALRKEQAIYPSIAIREIIANALIHQNMTITGAGPAIDIFLDRIEITNPGSPLVPPERFIDYPPRSRNENLASLMRRMGMCEEQGSGIDKTVTAIEAAELPPPDFRAADDFTKVILYAKRSFAHLTSEERLRACYQHSALRWLRGERLTNASLRIRFGIDEKNAAMMSRLITEAVEAKLIRIADPHAPRSGYVPIWA